jgi:hypothetical protein
MENTFRYWIISLPRKHEWGQLKRLLGLPEAKHYQNYLFSVPLPPRWNVVKHIETDPDKKGNTLNLWDILDSCKKTVGGVYLQGDFGFTWLNLPLIKQTAVAQPDTAHK